MSRAKLTICLLSLLVLALASAPAVADGLGCCQHEGRCYQTDDADACKAGGGRHSQLSTCKDGTCHDTAAGGPVDALFAEPVSCSADTQGR